MASSSAQVQDCIIANNSGAGLVYSGNGQVAVDGCVFDGNGTDHINISAGSSSIIRQSRFSYCGSGYYAINMSAATNARVIEDYNVFFANGGDTGATDTHDRLSVDVGANSIHVDSDDALGYTLRSSGNYNLTNAATLQSVSSSFDATNVLAMCAGLVPLTDYPTVDNVKSGVAFNRGLQGTYAAAGGISRARLVGGE